MSQPRKEDAVAMLESLIGGPQRGSLEPRAAGGVVNDQPPLAGLQAYVQTGTQERLSARKHARTQVDKPEKLVQFSTYARASLQEKLRRYAFESKRTVGSIVDEALSLYLAEEDAG